MDQGSSLGEEFQLLREHLARLSDQRYRRGLVHPLEGALSLTVLRLMCGYPSLSAIYRFGDTQPRLLSRLGLQRSRSAQTLSRLLPLYSAYPRFHEGRLCLRWGHPSLTVPTLPS